MPQRPPLWLPLQTLLLLAIMAVLPCRAAIALPEAGDEGRLRTLLRSEALSYENGEGVERDPVRAAKGGNGSVVSAPHAPGGTCL